MYEYMFSFYQNAICSRKPLISTVRHLAPHHSRASATPLFLCVCDAPLLAAIPRPSVFVTVGLESFGTFCFTLHLRATATGVCPILYTPNYKDPLSSQLSGRPDPAPHVLPLQKIKHLSRRRRSNRVRDGRRLAIRCYRGVVHGPITGDALKKCCIRINVTGLSPIYRRGPSSCGGRSLFGDRSPHCRPHRRCCL